ncbi:hypothetical protein CRUP_037429 [Coryphaenoides rupestris]|nr:hypothetical protein CRUP_037429 [Coryphaenoides rupestris]
MINNVALNTELLPELISKTYSLPREEEEEEEERRKEEEGGGRRRRRRSVILDIHFLSQTDFLVCTFSSQNAHNQVAVHAHQPRGSEDIPLEPGDLVGVAGNHWDGYSKGVNRKLGRTGLYPSYKVREKVETVKYPTYPEADKLLGVPPQQQNNNNNNNNINNNININDDNDNKGDRTAIFIPRLAHRDHVPRFDWLKPRKHGTAREAALAANQTGHRRRGQLQVSLSASGLRVITTRVTGDADLGRM